MSVAPAGRRGARARLGTAHYVAEPDGSAVSRTPLARVTADVLGRADVRAAVAATDWADHAVLDVIDYRPAASRGVEDDRPRTEIHRHRERAPPPRTDVTPERAVTVYRLTGPLVDRVR